MKIKSLRSKGEKGITLIALVVTIVVLLILAGVTITFVLDDGGILNMAKEAALAQDNAQIADALQLEASNCFMENIGNNTSLSLIDYLKTKQIIDGNNVINVKNLLGTELSTGKGTFENKKDIYVLEENGKVAANTTRLASIKMVQLAEESKNVKTYSVVYYDKSGNGKVIGNLNDTGVTESKKTITFEIEDGTSYQIEEGSTWRDVIAKYPDLFSSVSSGDKEYVNYKKGYLYSLPAGGYTLDPDDEVKAQMYFTLNAECIMPDSQLLTSLDGKTILAKEIQEGQNLAYFDFTTNEVRLGTVSKVYIHKDATNFVKYTFDDGSYLEATDYHPIYTQEGWRSLTNRNGYETPQVGDKVKTENGWKTLTNIEEYKGLEDCYDFAIESKDGQKVNNYFANGTLVQGSY